jgi:hypothetical protein
VSDNVGLHAEQYYQNVLEENPEFGGTRYDRMIANMICHDKKKGVVIEFDIVLLNCESIAIIEVKSSVRSDFLYIRW